MEYEFDDCLGELVSSEQLNAFSVIDRFCESCEKTTPHHIDESQTNQEQSFDSIEVTCVKPMSVHECVICSRDEEARLDTDIEGYL